MGVVFTKVSWSTFLFYRALSGRGDSLQHWKGLESSFHQVCDTSNLGCQQKGSLEFLIGLAYPCFLGRCLLMRFIICVVLKIRAFGI